MTKPTDLKVGDGVKMVNNDFPEHFPDKHAPLGRVGKVLSISKGGMMQPYFVAFEGFKQRWDPTSSVWYCTRHELRKLPGKVVA